MSNCSIDNKVNYENSKEDIKLKCGEIYVYKNKQNEIILSCSKCESQYLSLDSFSKHVFSENCMNDLTSLNNFKVEKNEVPSDLSDNENGGGNESNEEDHNALFVKNEEKDKELIKKEATFLLKEKKLSKEIKRKCNNRKSRKKIPIKETSEPLKIEEKTGHSKIHRNSERFICETCGKVYKKNSQLNQHMKNHTGERPFKCQFCSATFKSKDTKKNHERLHLNYKPFKCNICEMSFKTKRTAQLHEMRHLEPLDANFVCDLCGKKFNTHAKMTEHRGRHKEENKPFQCSKCPKSYQTKYACSAHERLNHKGEYNYKCSYCDKFFIKNAWKKSHELIHTRIGQPFPCNLCTKKYATREGLYKHKKRSHVSDKPFPDFECHKCKKSFKLENEYVEHCRWHVSEEYQFICTDCGANFANEINLKNHINIIHKSAKQNAKLIE